MKIVDMHCDTIERLYFLRKKNEEMWLQGQQETRGAETLQKNQGQLDLLRMRESGYYLQNFALFVDKALWQKRWKGVEALWEFYQRELEANQDLLRPVYSYEDIMKEDGRMRGLLAVEEGGVCQGSIKKLHRLYRKGVRMMTLTWNYRNELGVPATPIVGDENKPKGEMHIGTVSDGTKRNRLQDIGLTEKGRVFVQEMERLGMIVDVSHLSDAGFWEVAELAEKPFVASHSNARALCPHGRNLTDEMIAMIGEKGGCIGLNYHTDFLLPCLHEEKPKGAGRGELCKHIWEALVAHAKHIVDKGGIEVLGLGSDFDGIPTNEAIPGVEGVENLWWKLREGGFTEEQLDKIMYKNVLKVYKECL